MRRLPRSLARPVAAAIVVATLAAPGGAGRHVSAQAPLPNVLQFTIAAADAAGQIREASGIAEAPDGTVYVVDGAANRVQRFAPDGAVIDVWGDLGTAEGLFDGPAGIAVAGDGSVVVADTGNDRVQRFDARGQYLDRLGGPPGAPDALSGPVGVAVAADGTVYASDPGGNRVVRFAAGGALLGAFGDAGRAEDRLDEPRQVAVGPDGTVYVVDFRHDRVVRYAADGTRLGHFRTSDPHQPEREDLWLSALAVAADGTVYANQSIRSVYHFTPSGTETGELEVSAGGRVVALAAPGTGRLLVGVARHENYVAAQRLHVLSPLVIAEIDARDRPPYRITGVMTDTRRIGTRAPGDAPGQFEARTGFYPPRIAQAVAGDGTLYVADFGSRRLQWFRPDGLHMGERSGFGGERSYPTDGLGVAAAPDGSVWVADAGRSELVHLSRDGSPIGTLPVELPESFLGSGPAHGVTVLPDGTLFAANASSGSVQQVTAVGGLLDEWEGEWGAGALQYGMCRDWDVLGQPCSAQPIALAPDGGTVYLLDGANGRVKRFSADGTPQASWSGLGADGEIQVAAQGIAVGPDGAVVVADTPNRRVVRFAEDGSIGAVLDGTRAARGLRAAFDRPGGLAVAPDGTLYVADREGGRVLAFAHAPRDDWRAEYFGNPWLAERPLAIAHTAEIDLDWGLAAPDPALPADGWSARFERTYRLAGGDYLFFGEGEGGVRAWVGDALVVDAWNAAPGPWRRSYPFVLPADGEVAVRLELKDAGGAASLAWSLAHGPASRSTASPSPTGRVPSTPTSTTTPTGVAPHVDALFVPYAGR